MPTPRCSQPIRRWWTSPPTRPGSPRPRRSSRTSISCCRSTRRSRTGGHARAQPVWLMLPANWEFRWMQHATRTPWYPVRRIFRQSQRGDWSGVVDAHRRPAAALRRESITNVPDGDDDRVVAGRPPHDAPTGLTQTLETRHGVLQVQTGDDPSVDALERDGTWLPRSRSPPSCRCCNRCRGGRARQRHRGSRGRARAAARTVFAPPRRGSGSRAASRSRSRTSPRIVSAVA